jgi:hypothetical protein
MKNKPASFMAPNARMTGMASSAADERAEREEAAPASSLMPYDL